MFHNEFSELHRNQLLNGKSVRLPHNAVDLPLNYFDESVYFQQFCYQNILHCDAATLQKEVHLLFDAAMADTELFVNGERVLAHRDGYTPFEARITNFLFAGKNLLTVKIDGSENPDIPPFGGYIDYLTYAGIYRDVWLRVTDTAWISDTQILTPEPLDQRKLLRIHCTLDGHLDRIQRIGAVLEDSSGNPIATATGLAHGDEVVLEMPDLAGIQLWDIDSPNLYTVSLHLDMDSGGDSQKVKFGFRKAEFCADGFCLNGRMLTIRGLNRHQSFPYVGYAMGRRSQERDAEILKHELQCNFVRTSHYPQSPWFLDHCDRLGLLVFEEIPGWQHIGGDSWKTESLLNVSRMIRRDRNRPSVVLWGVRINESADDHVLYEKANRLAHRLDPSRQTAGVRCFAGSELLEDVYTMNDFVLGSEEAQGANHHRIALRTQSEVIVTRKQVPYLVTEFNGHMFPTKSFDNEQRHAEHVLRFLQVLNAAYGDPSIAGCIGWCMFDYNTHREFGSGDRICHHGVLDMFRIPKFAAFAYASQGNPKENVILQPVSYWSRGERSIGGVLPLIILTNCDVVELRVGEGKSQYFAPDRANFPHLPYAPVVVQSGEFAAGDFGDWGESWENLHLTGYIDGQAVARVKRTNSPIASRLSVYADDRELLAGEKDEIRIVVKALDQFDNSVPYLTDPLIVRVEGAASLIGPSDLVFRAGCAGFWIESTGREGYIQVQLSTPRFAPICLRLQAVQKQTSSAFQPISDFSLAKH